MPSKLVVADKSGHSGTLQAVDRVDAFATRSLETFGYAVGLLPIKLQKNLLNATNHYPKLTQDQKRRFQSRLERWSKLTPEQREHARNKFKIISKAPPEKREQLKRMVQEQGAIKSSASSVPESEVVR